MRTHERAVKPYANSEAGKINNSMISTIREVFDNLEGNYTSYNFPTTEMYNSFSHFTYQLIDNADCDLFEWAETSLS